MNITVSSGKGDAGCQIMSELNTMCLSPVQTRKKYPAQLYCDNPYTRAFNVMPTSYHGAFCIILC
jgi:hypothetical protein